MGLSTERTVRLGAGAGFAGDRIDPAVELTRHAELDYLIFECLGERTVAAGQVRRSADPSLGYDPLLVRRIAAVIEPALAAGTTIITNGGSANPDAGAEAVGEALRSLPLGRTVRIASVTGDDVLSTVRREDPLIWETGERVSDHTSELVSANAYLGADALLPALGEKPDIVITGRVADPSLYLAPLMHEFGWAEDDTILLGRGSCLGHLLECAGQLTGGYFADPGVKTVPRLASLGFPYADVAASGAAALSKLPGSGGLLDERTCKEQLLYEVNDPRRYLTPDVTADFSSVEFAGAGADRIEVRGASGGPRPADLKISLGFRGGWVGEGQMSYAGPRAEDRARLAGDIVVERLARVHGLPPEDVTVELIGTGSVFRGAPGSASGVTVPEVRLRVSARAGSEEEAAVVGWEVESLYTNGPAGGGGARSSVSETISIRAASLPRETITPKVALREVGR